MTTVPAPFATSPLRRLAQRPRPAVPAGGSSAGSAAGQDAPERCDLCAEALPEAHRHLLDLRAGEPVCACRACALLFENRAAGGTHYRQLPERRLRLDGCDIDDVLWARLGIPVDLAFFVRAEASGEVTAGYPNPLGTMRSTVALRTWTEVTGSHPALAELADDVEALLVHRAGGAREHWIVPVDDCYRLAAVVRTHWKGLAGGPDVWDRVRDFFTGLRSCAQEN